MITSILAIFAAILPFILDLFTVEAKKENTNVAFDKAIAEGNIADISAMLSARVDSLHGKKAGSDTGQQNPVRPE